MQQSFTNYVLVDVCVIVLYTLYTLSVTLILISFVWRLLKGFFWGEFVLKFSILIFFTYLSLIFAKMALYKLITLWIFHTNVKTYNVIYIFIFPFRVYRNKMLSKYNNHLSFTVRARTHLKRISYISGYWNFL